MYILYKLLFHKFMFLLISRYHNFINTPQISHFPFHQATVIKNSFSKLSDINRMNLWILLMHRLLSTFFSQSTCWQLSGCEGNISIFMCFYFFLFQELQLNTSQNLMNCWILFLRHVRREFIFFRVGLRYSNICFQEKGACGLTEIMYMLSRVNILYWRQKQARSKITQNNELVSSVHDR